MQQAVVLGLENPRVGDLCAHWLIRLSPCVPDMTVYVSDNGVPKEKENKRRKCKVRPAYKHWTYPFKSSIAHSSILEPLLVLLGCIRDDNVKRKTGSSLFSQTRTSWRIRCCTVLGRCTVRRGVLACQPLYY